jgi:hypothetical protein
MPPLWAAFAGRDRGRVQCSCLQTGKLPGRLPNRASSSWQIELEWNGGWRQVEQVVEVGVVVNYLFGSS